MNFLKSITAAALLATAISSGAMAAGALDRADDLDAFKPKVGLDITKGTEGTLTITDALIDKVADLKVYASTNATKPVATVIDKLAHSLAAFIEEITAEIDGNDLKAALATYKTESGKPNLVLKISKTFANSFSEDEMKAAFRKSAQSFLDSLSTDSPVEKDLKDLAKFSKSGDEKVFHGTVTDGSKKDITIAELLTEYGTIAKDKKKKATLDAIVKVLKAKNGDDFDDVVKKARDQFAHVVPGQEADFHAVRKIAFDKGVASAKATDEQLAGEAILTSLQGMIAADLIEFDSKKDLTKAKNYQDLVTKLEETLALVDRLTAQNETLTEERDDARSKIGTGTGTGTGKGIASLGGGGSKPAAPKGKDVTATHAAKYASAEGMGHGDDYLAKNKLTKHGGKLYS